MTCCPTATPAAQASVIDTENAPAPHDDATRGCAKWGSASRPVARRTILLMLKPELFDRVGVGEYRFCTDQDCRMVYFTEGGGPFFTTDDLRVRVGMKEKDDPIHLCYCFGFDESDARAEIALTGRCSIPQSIAALIKQGVCACPERNPSGACCLGEVNRAVKRLMTEAVESSRPS